MANLSVLFILKRYGLWEAAVVSAVRILVIGFLFGNLFSILYSGAGALLSLVIMYLLLQNSDLSTPAVSIIGGISHNIGQLIIAALIVENRRLLFYAPVLVLSGILAGLVIGILTQETLKRLP